MGDAKNKTGRKGGRPRFEATAEQLSAARRLLGRLVYRSEIVAKLQEKFPDLGRDSAYKVLDVATEEAKRELAASGGVDPAVLAYSGLLNVATGENTSDKNIIAAWGKIIRLLGLKAIKDLGDAGEIEEFLRQIGIRQKTHAAESGASVAATPTAATGSAK